MNEHSELPFMNAKDMQGMPPFMAMAMWPWMMASFMMANAMSFWTLAARGNMGNDWALADSLDNTEDAPAEELLPHEHLTPQKFKGKH
jgi:hypothetical protein